MIQLALDLGAIFLGVVAVLWALTAIHDIAEHEVARINRKRRGE